MLGAGVIPPPEPPDEPECAHAAILSTVAEKSETVAHGAPDRREKKWGFTGSTGEESTTLKRVGEVQATNERTRSLVELV